MSISVIKYYLYKSTNPKKKYMIKYINPNTDRENTIHFGASGMSDYTIHKDDKRKNRYIKRHSGMGENWNDPQTAGFYSRWLLWNKPSLSTSIRDTNEKFDIKIINKI